MVLTTAQRLTALENGQGSITGRLDQLEKLVLPPKQMVLTQAQYNALTTPSPNTIYYVTK